MFNKVKKVVSLFLIFGVVSLMGNSTDEKIEKLKNECERLSYKYSESRIMLNNYVEKFNQKISGKDFTLTKKVIFTKIWQNRDNHNYYARVKLLDEVSEFYKKQEERFNKQRLPDFIRKKIRNNAEKYGNADFQLKIYLKNSDKLIMQVERLIKNKIEVTIVIGGKASSSVCSIKSNRTVFKDRELVVKKILKYNPYYGRYQVIGVEPPELVKIAESDEHLSALIHKKSKQALVDLNTKKEKALKEIEEEKKIRELQILLAQKNREMKLETAKKREVMERALMQKEKEDDKEAKIMLAKKRKIELGIKRAKNKVHRAKKRELRAKKKRLLARLANFEKKYHFTKLNSHSKITDESLDAFFDMLDKFEMEFPTMSGETCPAYYDKLKNSFDKLYDGMDSLVIAGINGLDENIYSCIRKNIRNMK